MIAYPLLQPVAFVPTGVVPNEDNHSLPFLPRYFQQRNDEYPHILTVGLPIAKVNINLPCVLPHRAKTGQGFLFLIAFGFPLNQVQGLAR